MEVVVFKVNIYKDTPFNKFINKIFKTRVYWIEYRIDEDRFWFGRRVWFKKYMHHTKNNKVNSLRIVKGIVNRSKVYGYNFEVLTDNTKLDFSHEVGGIFLK